MSGRLGPLLGISLRQQARDRVSLALTVLTPPLFAVLYWVFFSSGAPPLRLGVVAEPGGEQAHVGGARTALAEVAELRAFDDRDALNAAIRTGAVDAGVVLPADLLRDPAQPSVVTLVGDPASPAATRAAAAVGAALEGYAAAKLGRYPPVTLRHESLGSRHVRSAFDRYVPGLLVFAIIMLVFSASLAVAREVEAGTVVRLRLAGVPGWQLLAGLSGVQLALGIASVLLTLAVAVMLGFHSEGALLAAALVAVLGCVASVGLGLVVAGIARTTMRAFLVASVVMFLLILFSGIIFPQPHVRLFEVAGHRVELFDALPTTHVGRAFTAVLVEGRSAAAITYEAILLVVGSAASLVLGAVLFGRSKPA